MPQIEVSLPRKIDTEIDRLVEQEEFVNRDQAIETLLSNGILVYDTADESPSEMTEDVFTQSVDDQQDPAMQDD